MARKLGGKKLTGKNPLAYLGVESSSPSNFLRISRSPTINDTDHEIGTIWLHEKNDSSVTNDVYMLVDIDNALNSSTTPQGPAQWIMFGSGSGDIISITGDTGGAVFSDDDNNINVLGAHGINTDGTPASNQLEVAINNTITLGDLSVVTSTNDALTIQSGDISLSGTGSSAGGNLNMPNTGGTVEGDIGVINFGGVRHFHIGNSAITLPCVFVGPNAGNFTGVARNVTAVGNNCFNSVTTGTGTGVGSGALQSLTTATGNSAVGFQALNALTTAGGNQAFGSQALLNNVTGSGNSAIGHLAMATATSGDGNISIGSTVDPVVGGFSALRNLLSGSYNIAIGAGNNVDLDGAGFNYTGSESSNILISNSGTLGESNTMRLGTTGSGNGQVNRCFVAGVRGVTTGVADAVAVLIDSAAQLGTVSSSIRVKKNIEDMDNSTGALFDLRPVNFDYIDSPSERRQYGLIAEEVEKIMPDLVVYDKGGNPESVRYHEIPVMLLNEIKKLKIIIDDLKERVSHLESYVS